MNTIFKPILFSTAMVQAILEGRKSQTRRIIKPQPIGDQSSGLVFYKKFHFEGTNWQEEILKIAKFQMGDIMWVRETWQYSDDLNDPYLYKQKYQEEYLPEHHGEMKWKPSIFMPKDACRIFLKVTKVRIERLQDITEEDAKAEGVFYYGDETLDYMNYMHDNKHFDDWGVMTAKHSFETLWEKINSKESWKENPWVFVYDFEHIEKPQNFK